MFAVHQLKRSLHTSVRCLLPRIARRANPGIGYQLETCEDGINKLQADPEALDECFEPDFMSSGQLLREQRIELAQRRDRVRQLMVKHKYFRDQKLPNLLTYAEKEQIRLLHDRDPEEWTVERLAESFPATPAIVEKILQSKWRPRSLKRIRVHDEAVIRNWEQLRAGKCEVPLPEALTDHLKKFTDRKMHDLKISSEQWPTRTNLPKPKGSEFQSIITSCSKYAKSSKTGEQALSKYESQFIEANTSESSSQSIQVSEDETYLLSKVGDKRRMRIQELKQFKLSAADLATCDIDKRAAEEMQNPSGTGVLAIRTQSNSSSPPASTFTEKFQSNEIVISIEDQKRFEMSTVKDRIHIPRKIWRKGATFRVEDAYYDDDGEFLFRVPGMTGKWN